MVGLIKKINSEKILTITASEYCEMRGKNLRDYDPVGVYRDWCDRELKVPKDTEVVVDYQFKFVADHTNGYVQAGIGIALVPKQDLKPLPTI